MKFTKDSIEQAVLDWLHELSYTILHRGLIAPSEPAAERSKYSEVLLMGWLHSVLE